MSDSSWDPDRTKTVDESIPTSWTGLEVASRYLVGAQIGAGGGGSVYFATDLHRKRRVAIKFQSFTPETRRSRRETGALLRLLRIPGVVQVFDEGTERQTPYIVMEYIDGTRFPGVGVEHTWESIEGTTRALLETLARVHSTWLIHRDLKPSNVLVDDDGIPTILDFGLAWGPELGERLTAQDCFLGTPHYSAPEQIGGNPVDARTDLYAIGVMLYETTRQPPALCSRGCPLAYREPDP